MAELVELLSLLVDVGGELAADLQYVVGDGAETVLDVLLGAGECDGQVLACADGAIAVVDDLLDVGTVGLKVGQQRWDGIGHREGRKDSGW